MEDALVVGDDQHAHVGAGELVDPIGDDPQGVDVEAGVGLVEDGDLGPQQRQLQQLHPLLLTAGEAVVEVAAGEGFGDVGQLHRLLGDLGELFDLDLGFATRLAASVEDHPQVLADRDAGDRHRVLEGHEEAGAGALVGVGLGQVLALEDDRALGHLERGVAHDRVRQGRLARPVRPHQRVYPSLLDVEVEAAQDLLALGAHMQVAYLQLSHRSPVRVVFGLSGAADRRGVRGASCLPPANSTSSASVVPASALVTPPCTRVHSSFVAQSRSPSLSCEQSTLPSGVSWKHSIGAIWPSSASTTASRVISSAGLARR